MKYTKYNKFSIDFSVSDRVLESSFWLNFITWLPKSCGLADVCRFYMKFKSCEV